MALFSEEALGRCSAVRLAAIEFCGGDKEAADAIIKAGNFIFLPNVKTIEALGAEAFFSSVGKRFRKKYMASVDTLAQAEYELKLSGGKLTRYGFFQLRHSDGFKRGFIERAVRRRELDAAVSNVATDVLGEMLAEGFKFFK